MIYIYLYIYIYVIINIYNEDIYIHIKYIQILSQDFYKLQTLSPNVPWIKWMSLDVLGARGLYGPDPHVVRAGRLRWHLGQCEFAQRNSPPKPQRQ